MKIKKAYQSKIRLAIIFLIAVLLLGVFGYRYVAHYSWIDALYMTAITVTTVGFGEVQPLDDASKLFTVFLILFSIFFITYAISVISEYILDRNNFENLKQSRMEKKIAKLQNHIIICGFGRNGRQAAKKLAAHNETFVVIERCRETIEKYNEDVFFVEGDANEDEILVTAGIKKAKSIIVALPSDADNLFVVLSARQLNTKLLIISRASNDSSCSKLKLAGANNVIMPDKIGGDHMASLVAIPDLVEFLDNLSIMGENSVNVEQIDVEVLTDTVKNKTIRDLDFRQQTGCSIIGYKTSQGNYVINPEADMVLEANSKIIVLGRPEQITALNTMFNL